MLDQKSEDPAHLQIRIDWTISMSGALVYAQIIDLTIRAEAIALQNLQLTFVSHQVLCIERELL